jgi:glycosyltransferase involved in cell wall biosynthesis
MDHAAIDHVIVVVPALDEATTIAATIDSIRRAFRGVSATVTTDLVVAVDRRSRDGTAALARASLGSAGVVLEDDFGTVGAARRHGTDVGLRRASSAHRRTWLATTDADTTVPDRWLASQLVLVEAGAVAIAGIIELHEPSSALADRFRAHYVLHPDGTHPHVHGANLGVRADAYLEAGGWLDHESGEDHDLWRRLRAIGPVLHSTAVCVATSARPVGRAPRGFADDLAALESSA